MSKYDRSVESVRPPWIRPSIDECRRCGTTKPELVPMSEDELSSALARIQRGDKDSGFIFAAIMNDYHQLVCQAKRLLKK